MRLNLCTVLVLDRVSIFNRRAFLQVVVLLIELGVSIG